MRARTKAAGRLALLTLLLIALTLTALAMTMLAVVGILSIPG